MRVDRFPQLSDFRPQYWCFLRLVTGIKPHVSTVNPVYCNSWKSLLPCKMAFRDKYCIIIKLEELLWYHTLINRQYKLRFFQTKDHSLLYIFLFGFCHCPQWRKLRFALPLSLVQYVMVYAIMIGYKSVVDDQCLMRQSLCTSPKTCEAWIENCEVPHFFHLTWTLDKRLPSHLDIRQETSISLGLETFPSQNHLSGTWQCFMQDPRA